jgi:ribosome-associated protein YbcJ (S4-like RNA binding protein)
MALTTVFVIKRLDVAQSGGEVKSFLRMKSWVMKSGS